MGVLWAFGALAISTLGFSRCVFIARSCTSSFPNAFPLLLHISHSMKSCPGPISPPPQLFPTLALPLSLPLSTTTLLLALLPTTQHLQMARLLRQRPLRLSSQPSGIFLPVTTAIVSTTPTHKHTHTFSLPPSPSLSPSPLEERRKDMKCKITHLSNLPLLHQLLLLGRNGPLTLFGAEGGWFARGG